MWRMMPCTLHAPLHAACSTARCMAPATLQAVCIVQLRAARVSLEALRQGVDSTDLLILSLMRRPPRSAVQTVLSAPQPSPQAAHAPLLGGPLWATSDPWDSAVWLNQSDGAAPAAVALADPAAHVAAQDHRNDRRGLPQPSMAVRTARATFCGEAATPAPFAVYHGQRVGSVCMRARIAARALLCRCARCIAP